MPLTNHLGRIPRNCYLFFYPDTTSSHKIREEHLYLASGLFGLGGVVDVKGMGPFLRQPSAILRPDPRTQILPKLHTDIEPLVISTIVPGTDVAAILVQFLVFLGTNETGAEKLEPSLTAMPDGTLMEFKGQSTSLQQEYASQEGTMPRGSRYICDSVWFKDGIDFVAVTRRMFREFPRDRSMVYWEPLYPTSRRKLPDMAFSLQADQYLALFAVFEESQQDEEQGTRIQEFIQEIEPYVLGTFAADGVPEVRKTQYWPVEVIERLYSVCQKWDPAHRLGCTLLDPTRKVKS
jgi:hypothetical protein